LKKCCEGGDADKSVWSYLPKVEIGWATYVLQWILQKEAIYKLKQIFKNIQSSCRLSSVIRRYEGGIASNRVSAASRWICSEVAYKPPVTHWEKVLVKTVRFPI